MVWSVVLTRAYRNVCMVASVAVMSVWYVSADGNATLADTLLRDFLVTARAYPVDAMRAFTDQSQMKKWSSAITSSVASPVARARARRHCDHLNLLVDLPIGQALDRLEHPVGLAPDGHGRRHPLAGRQTPERCDGGALVLRSSRQSKAQWRMTHHERKHLWNVALCPRAAA